MTSWGTIWGKHGGGFGSAMVVLWMFLSVANFVCVGVSPEEGKNKVGPKKGECDLELKALLRLSNR